MSSKDYLTKSITIKLTNADKELLEQVASNRGEGIASFVRRAIRKELASLSYYSLEVKKALDLNRTREE
jgi:uncharacterized protein (DUF1778 family)